jgi:hypothetical protein
VSPPFGSFSRARAERLLEDFFFAEVFLAADFFVALRFFVAIVVF